ncbi:MAG TPA: pitrilysin family protein [Candidatus Saccharimonadia bacterium]|nr:pitrilysin family protein [Candidatus Saccharimonadia bacterium]
MKHTVTQHKLDSGARGLVINVPSSDVVNILVRFNSGYQFADQHVYEVPHVMEHLLATVTQKYPAPNQFMIEAQKNGAYVNANTSSNYNGYVYECADFELDRILDLVEEQVVRPLFAPKALAAELGNVREELSRNTTQHGSVCSIRLGEKAYPGQIMDYEARIAQLDDITLESVERHYHHTHTAANARFFVAGTFADGGAAVVRRLERIFAQLPTGRRLPRSQAIGHNVPEPLVARRDIKQLYYALGLYLGELTEAERRAMSLLRLVLVGGFSSRILGEARRRGLAYGLSASGQTEPGNSAFSFSGYVTPANAEELYKLIAREMRAMREGRLEEAELTAAKQLGIGSTKRSYQTAADILSWYVAPYDNEGKVVDFNGYLDELQAVTPAEVVAVAGKIALSGRHGFSVVGDVDDLAASSYAKRLAAIWE